MANCCDADSIAKKHLMIVVIFKTFITFESTCFPINDLHGKLKSINKSTSTDVRVRRIMICNLPVYIQVARVANP